MTLDANGNTTALHGLSFNYNPHNRLVSVPNTAQYRYNARGERISKLQINPNTANNGRRTLFVYAHTELLAETGPTGAVKREYIYLNSQPVAVLDRVPSSAELFLRADFDRDGTISWEDFYEWYYLHYLGTPDPAYDLTGDGVTDSADLNALVNCVQRCTASQYETRLYYVHTDHLGTPKVMTDSTGATVWAARHGPFGRATVDSASTIQMPLRFPGQYFDGETGLHYNYFRTYDPGTGRYLESDPIGLEGGLNTFLYVAANPSRYDDPRGLEAVPGTGTGLFPSPALHPVFQPGTAANDAFVDSTTKLLNALSKPFNDDGPFELPPEYEPIDRDKLICTIGVPEPVPPMPPDPRDVCEIAFAKRVNNCKSHPGKHYASCIAFAYIKYLGCRALRGFDPPSD